MAITIPGKFEDAVREFALAIESGRKYKQSVFLCAVSPEEDSLNMIPYTGSVTIFSDETERMGYEHPIEFYNSLFLLAQWKLIKELIPTYRDIFSLVTLRRTDESLLWVFRVR